LLEKEKDDISLLFSKALEGKLEEEEHVKHLDDRICLFTHPNKIELVACKECYPFENEQEQELESPNQEGNFQLMKTIWFPESQ